MPASSAASDHDLVLLARTGDRAAWSQLYARYSDRLYDYACRLTGSRAQGADCMQDAFLLAVERIGQLRDPDKVRPWLYAIVRSTAHRHYRVANRFSNQDVPDDADSSAGDDVMVGGVHGSELAALFAEAAAGLTDEDRQVLDLHLRHDLTPAEIADALGVSTRHAAVTTERMRERLGRSIVVTVLARRPECPQFATMSQAEGPLTPLSRKRLARHVDDCAVCTAQKDRQVKPEAMLGALPLLLLSTKKAFGDYQPGDRAATPDRAFETRFDEAIRRLQAGAPPPDGGLDWDGDGFPTIRRSRRATWLPWAVAGIVGVLAGAGLVRWLGDDAPAGSVSLQTLPPVTPSVADPSATTSSTPASSTSVVVPSAAPSTVPPSVVPEGVDGAPRPSLVPAGSTPAPTTAGTTVPAPPAPTTTVRPSTPTTVRPTATTAPAAPTTAASSPTTAATTGTTTAPPTTVATTAPPTTVAATAPPTTAAPTTTAPDTAGPAIGSPSGSPAAIGVTSSGTSKCRIPPAFSANYPTTSSVSVSISDPSGVTSVTFTWAAGTASGGGTMSPSGGNWVGTVGPVPETAIPGPADSTQESSASMSVTITAKDALGNTTVVTKAAGVSVRNCYVIL